MTQKELLYVEDAINHEKSIIQILSDAINNLNDENFVSYMQNEQATHEKIKNDLITLLKETANER